VFSENLCQQFLKNPDVLIELKDFTYADLRRYDIQNKHLKNPGNDKYYNYSGASVLEVYRYVLELGQEQSLQQKNSLKDNGKKKFDFVSGIRCVDTIWGDDNVHGVAFNEREILGDVQFVVGLKQNVPREEFIATVYHEGVHLLQYWNSITRFPLSKRNEKMRDSYREEKRKIAKGDVDDYKDGGWIDTLKEKHPEGFFIESARMLCYEVNAYELTSWYVKDRSTKVNLSKALTADAERSLSKIEEYIYRNYTPKLWEQISDEKRQFQKEFCYAYATKSPDLALLFMEVFYKAFYENDSEEQLRLVKLYNNNFDLFDNSKSSKKWALKAIDNNNTDAILYLVKIMREESFGFSRDKLLELKLINKALQLELKGAKHEYALALLGGYIVKKDIASALDILENLGKGGSQRSAEVLASLYHVNCIDIEHCNNKSDYIGIDEDPELALQWFDYAIQAGSPMAAYVIGSLYLKKNLPKEANHYFKLAASYVRIYTKYSGMAHFKLGESYATGRGIEKNVILMIDNWDRADRWYKNQDAMIGLAEYYWYAKAGEVDGMSASQLLEKSKRYYKKAIELGSKPATNSYVWALSTSPGATQNEKFEAVEMISPLVLEQFELHKKGEKLTVSGNDYFYYWATVAAAFANGGKFKEAIFTQNKVLPWLKDESMKIKFENILNKYKQNEPWREKLNQKDTFLTD
jgi:TPR repeat protein